MAGEKDMYKQLAGKIMASGDGLIPDLFRMLADEREAEILLALPGTAPEVAEKMGMDEKAIEDMMHDFFLKGLVFKSKKPDGVKYRLCRNLLQFHDASILWKGATPAFLEIRRLVLR